MVADIPQSLLRCALGGGSLPHGLLFQAVKRNRAEQGITRPRAALIKAVLASQIQNPKEVEAMEQMDSSNRHPAYLCGRLLAELDEAQRQAIPGVKATIVDRYFGAASSAPASVFGTLLHGVQPHLSKLRKEKEGAFYAIESRIMDIVKDLPDFPKFLTLKEQALFSLGYYHQKVANRAAAIARKEAKSEKQKEEE